MNQTELLRRIRSIAALPDTEALAELTELSAELRRKQPPTIEQQIAEITAKVQNAYGVERAARELNALKIETEQDKYRLNAAQYYVATARAIRKRDQFRVLQNANRIKASQKMLFEAIAILAVDWKVVFGEEAEPPKDIHTI